jgi:hypothetical protein
MSLKYEKIHSGYKTALAYSTNRLESSVSQFMYRRSFKYVDYTDSNGRMPNWNAVVGSSGDAFLKHEYIFAWRN